jgi:hypothetical protein
MRAIGSTHDSFAATRGYYPSLIKNALIILHRASLSSSPVQPTSRKRAYNPGWKGPLVPVLEQGPTIRN